MDSFAEGGKNQTKLVSKIHHEAKSKIGFMGQIGEYFHLALRNLKSRSLRSWLTIFGIVIGVFLIVALISLSGGLQETVMTQLRMMGPDLIMVMPGEMQDMMTLLWAEWN